MPGDRKHHTDKWRSCVERVMAQGHDESSASAICTASLQKAGEPIFEDLEESMSDMRHLHLRGATGRARTEMYDGREHLVVPVVALMEGVIHAVNADTPEFVSVATLQKAAASWNGRPVTLGHPKKDGKQCSANAPEIREAHGIGTIFNSRVEGKKLLCEAWIDKTRAEKLDAAMLARLLANQREEVSVGAFVVTDGKAGDHQGKAYHASWLETTGDHLAFLPGGRGACSIEMGCGAHRTASCFVTAEGFEQDPLEDLALRILKTKYEDCHACKGSGNVNGNPCEACDGEGELRVAMGARNSAKDFEIIQAVHDHAMTLGAKCERTNYKMLQVHLDGKKIATTTFEVKEEQDTLLISAATGRTPELKAACRCEGEHIMDKTKKAELIAALVTDKHSGFKEGDEPFLETATDARLEEFRSAAEANKTAAEAAIKLENEQRATAAKLTVMEGKLKAAEAKPTTEEWLEKAPPEIKTLLDHQKAQETEQREALIKELKGVGANTEDELKAMGIDQLKTLAKYAKVEQVDFRARGIPAPRNADADKEDYAPPSPYAAGIAALQAKAVN